MVASRQSLSEARFLVHPNILNEVFDVVDVTGRGSITVHDFIVVCPSFFKLTSSALLVHWLCFPLESSTAIYRFSSLYVLLSPIDCVQALRTNPVIGHLLDRGTISGQMEDSGKLFENVFQRLDCDSMKRVNASDFQGYFRTETNYQDDADFAHSKLSPGTRTSHSSQPKTKAEVYFSGCCPGRRGRYGTTGRRDDPRASQGTISSHAGSHFSEMQGFPKSNFQEQSVKGESTNSAPAIPDNCVSFQDDKESLRAQLRHKEIKVRAIDNRLGAVEKDIMQLHLEYNLQSLKQDMLVHMWSMHMLDADHEDEN